MLDDDFILDADESLKTVPCERTGWEVVIFELVEDEDPRAED